MGVLRRLQLLGELRLFCRRRRSARLCGLVLAHRRSLLLGLLLRRDLAPRARAVELLDVLVQRLDARVPVRVNKRQMCTGERVKSL